MSVPAGLQKTRDKLSRITTRQWALGLAAIALLVRLPLMLSDEGYEDSRYLEIYTDTLTYRDVATDLSEGRGFESGGAYRTPGYPIFLWLLRPLPGGTLDAAVNAQHLLGVILVGAVVLLGASFFGRLGACVAGAILALSPTMVTAEHAVLPDFLFGVLACGAAAALAVTATRDFADRRWLLATAAAMGMAAYVKPTGQLLVAAVPLAAFVATRSARQTLMATSTALLVVAVIVAPWVIRNGVKYGEWTMSIQGGHALFLRAFDQDRLPIPTDTPEGRLAKHVHEETYARGEGNSYTHVYNALTDQTKVDEPSVAASGPAGLSPAAATDAMGDLALKAISDHPRTYLEGTYRNLRRHLTAVGAAGESPGLADTEGLAKSDLEQTGSKLPVALTKAAWAGGETLTRVWWVLSLNALAGLLLLLGPTRETRRAASAFVAVWLVVAAATSMTNAVEPRFALQVAAITYLLGAAGAALAACAVMTRLSANWSAPPRRDTEKPSDL